MTAPTIPSLLIPPQVVRCVVAYSPLHGHTLLVALSAYKGIPGLAQVIDRTTGPCDYSESVEWARQRVEDSNALGLTRYELVEAL